jgi:Fur family peroxide stress response transcriptional regulator
MAWLRGVLKIIRTTQEMEKALRAAGYRITRQRKAILNYLATTDAHPSAQQVFQEAKKEHPGLSLATVYNTLETLARMGLIKILDFQVMDNRHETNLAPHINLICTSCGKIQDFEEGLIIRASEVKQKSGFQVENFRLEYYGLCSACRVKTSNAGGI